MFLFSSITAWPASASVGLRFAIYTTETGSLESGISSRTTAVQDLLAAEARSVPRHFQLLCGKLKTRRVLVRCQNIYLELIVSTWQKKTVCDICNIRTELFFCVTLFGCDLISIHMHRFADNFSNCTVNLKPDTFLFYVTDILNLHKQRTYRAVFPRHISWV